MAERATQDRRVPGSIPTWIQLDCVSKYITRNDGYIAMINQKKLLEPSEYRTQLWYPYLYIRYSDTHCMWEVFILHAYFPHL